MKILARKIQLDFPYSRESKEFLDDRKYSSLERYGRTRKRGEREEKNESQRGGTIKEWEIVNASRVLKR